MGFLEVGSVILSSNPTFRMTVKMARAVHTSMAIYTLELRFLSCIEITLIYLQVHPDVRFLTPLIFNRVRGFSFSSFFCNSDFFINDIPCFLFRQLFCFSYYLVNHSAQRWLRYNKLRGGVIIKKQENLGQSPK